MREHAASLLLALDEPQHALIVLDCDEHMRLTNFHFERLFPDAYKPGEVERLTSEGEEILRTRVEKHTSNSERLEEMIRVHVAAASSTKNVTGGEGYLNIE